MDNVWRQVSLVGTELTSDLTRVSTALWDFSHLDAALSPGGALAKEQVYLFGSTEVPDAERVVPFVVAVSRKNSGSFKPPPAAIGLNSIQREKESLLPMSALKMEWIPVWESGELIERSLAHGGEARVFALGCKQRVAGSRNISMEKKMNWAYAHPLVHFSDRKNVETKLNFAVTVTLPGLTEPVEFYYDPDFEEVDAEEKAEEVFEEVVDDRNVKLDKKTCLRIILKKIQTELRVAGKEQAVRQKEKLDRLTQLDAIRARSEWRVVKFYPQDVDARFRQSFLINRYYGKADEVLPKPVDQSGSNAPVWTPSAPK